MKPQDAVEAAERRLALWRRRAIVRVRHAQGLSMEEIAQEAGCSLAAVKRDIYYVRRVAGNPPVMPSLLIDRRAVGEIDTSTLMAALSAWLYTESIDAPEWVEGMIPGSWFDVVQARFDGRLTPGEYESLLPFKPAEEPVRTTRADVGTLPDRLGPIVDALHDHLAVRAVDDLTDPPLACSCGRWDPRGWSPWEEHIASEVLVRQGQAPAGPHAIVQRVRAVLRLLGDTDITPTGRRQLERVLEAIEVENERRP